MRWNQNWKSISIYTLSIYYLDISSLLMQVKCIKVKMIHHDFYHPNVKDSNIDYGDCTLLFNKYKLQSNAHS